MKQVVRYEARDGTLHHSYAEADSADKRYELRVLFHNKIYITHNETRNGTECARLTADFITENFSKIRSIMEAETEVP